MLRNGIFPRQCTTVICSALFLFSFLVKADDLYVADFGNNTVEQIDSSGHSTVYVNSGLDGPMGVAFDKNGNLYIGNWYSGTIVKVTPNGQSTVFASGLNYPRGMAFDSAGNLYVANYYGNSIVKFNSAGQESFFAGGLNQPTGLAVGPDGNIYVADRNNNITKFNPNGQGTLFVSTGSYPEGLAFDSSGNLYVACYYSQAIYKYDPNGSGGFFASTGSGYNNPFGLAFDSSGNLYVSCNVNVIDKIDPSGNLTGFANTLSGPWYIAVKPVTPSPTLTCPEPQTVECGTLATVTAQVGEPDGSAVTVVWALNGTLVQTNQIPAGPAPTTTNVSFTAELPLGTNLIKIAAANSSTNTASCSTTVTVVDTTPPVIQGANASPNVLWPPNHKIVTVTVNAVVTDNCGPATWKIIGVQSNEPVNGKGDGNTTPDWQILGDHSVALRAERSSNGSGRIYTITLQAEDVAGNFSTPTTVTVTVPKSMGK